MVQTFCESGLLQALCYTVANERDESGFTQHIEPMVQTVCESGLLQALCHAVANKRDESGFTQHIEPMLATQDFAALLVGSPPGCAPILW
jgi:hypothetical protein